MSVLTPEPSSPSLIILSPECDRDRVAVAFLAPDSHCSYISPRRFVAITSRSFVFRLSTINTNCTPLSPIEHELLRGSCSSDIKARALAWDSVSINSGGWNCSRVVVYITECLIIICGLDNCAWI